MQAIVFHALKCTGRREEGSVCSCRTLLANFLEDASTLRLFVVGEGRDLTAVSMRRVRKYVATLQKTDTQSFLQLAKPPASLKRKTLYFVKLRSSPVTAENVQDLVSLARAVTSPNKFVSRTSKAASCARRCCTESAPIPLWTSSITYPGT